MSGSAFLAADPQRVERMRRFGRAISSWAGGEGLLASGAAHRLGVGRQLMGDIVAGRSDPLDIGPSTAMRILQVTGLSASYLGFENSASEGIKPPLADVGSPAASHGQAEGAPAADPREAAGAPFIFRRPGSAIGAWYEAPGTIVLHLSATDTRLGELSARLSPDDCDHAIAALTQARNAARRAIATSRHYREA